MENTDNIRIEQNYIYVTPSVTASNIKSMYPDAVIVRTDGVDISGSSELIGTAAYVTTGGKTCLTVKMADISGDGKIDSMDMYLLIQYLLGNMTYSDPQGRAADVNRDSKIDSMDMYQIIQHLLGNGTIKI